jgi:hypothetical protein
MFILLVYAFSGFRNDKAYSMRAAQAVRDRMEGLDTRFSAKLVTVQAAISQDSLPQNPS